MPKKGKMPLTFDPKMTHAHLTFQFLKVMNDLAGASDTIGHSTV